MTKKTKKVIEARGYDSFAVGFGNIILEETAKNSIAIGQDIKIEEPLHLKIEFYGKGWKGNKVKMWAKITKKEHKILMAIFGRMIIGTYLTKQSNG